MPVPYEGSLICSHCELIYSRDTIVCKQCGSSLDAFEEFYVENKWEEIEKDDDTVCSNKACEDCSKCQDCDRIEKDDDTVCSKKDCEDRIIEVLT